jgi:anti-sigma-K factor RskA
VSGPASGHGLFEELAAGYALDALEPEDAQLFLEHARDCPQCGPALAAYREVAAVLADTAPPAEPSAQLGERILAMARATVPQAPGPPAAAPQTASPPDHQRDQHAKLPPGVHRLPSRHRWVRPASIAAAVVLIAGGGIWGGLEATSSSPRPPAAFCAHGCSEIVLTAKGDAHQVEGKVYVRQQSVWMDPTHMAPDDTADQIYVLWQIYGSKAPLAIGSFDVEAGVSGPVEVGSLAAPYHGTVAFAVSLEPGRSIPASPSSVRAVGDVS